MKPVCDKCHGVGELDEGGFALLGQVYFSVYNCDVCLGTGICSDVNVAKHMQSANKRGHV